MMTDDIEYDFDTQTWHRVAEDCFGKRRLYPSERTFVEDMIAQTLLGRKPSSAQARWLMKIHGRREIDGNENRDL